MKIVFVSWSSDSPEIQKALEKACRRIEKEGNYYFDVAVRDENGAQDIAKSIFRKICKADYFIADTSFLEHERPVVNSNVAIETGFALAQLTADKILLLRKKLPNSIAGPFDIRNLNTKAIDTSIDQLDVKIEAHIIKFLQNHDNGEDLLEVELVNAIFQNNKLTLDLVNRLEINLVATLINVGGSVHKVDTVFASNSSTPINLEVTNHTNLARGGLMIIVSDESGKLQFQVKYNIRKFGNEYFVHSSIDSYKDLRAIGD